MAESYIKENIIPIHILIFIGMRAANAEKTLVNAYTYGLERFGKKNMEIIESAESPQDI